MRSGLLQKRRFYPLGDAAETLGYSIDYCRKLFKKLEYLMSQKFILELFKQL